MRQDTRAEALHIGVDASRAATRQRTGTEQYTVQLLEALGRLDTRNHYSLYINSRVAPRLALPGNFRARLIPLPRLWTHARLSLELRASPPDVLFVPAHVVPLVHPRTVVTIHDLGYRAFPEAHPALSRAYLEWSTRWSARAARQVLVPSAVTGRDLAASYGIPRERITVVPHGYHPRYQPRPLDEVAAGLVRLRLRQPYILFVGTLQPRKNLARVLEAFASLVARGLPHRLVLVGQRGWLAEPLFTALAAANPAVRDRIDVTGYLADDDLPLLYNGAALLAFPSLHEGFGLPAVEALACGTPVLTSTTSALPEVVGDAALLVDPTDTAAISAGLARLATDVTLRESLRQRGLARAATFSWARAARQTLDLLEATAREG